VSDLVPEYWEYGTSTVPPRARRVGWLLALPTLMALPLAPKRLGPAIAQAGWTLTLSVHGLCVVAAVVLGVYADSLCYSPFQGIWALVSGPTVEPADSEAFERARTWSESVRVFLTSVVNLLYIRTRGHGDIYALIGGLAAVPAGTWLVGLLLMPFVSAGERSRLLYLRGVKLTLWSAACLVPLGLAILGVVYLGVTYDEHFDNVEWETTFAGVAAVWSLWWLSVLLRLGARYGGPADGPGWQPRQPQCNRCGYVLTGLSRDGRCPECGLAVHESLPEARRPSPWACAAKIGRKPGAYARTMWRVLRRGSFFRSLAVYDSLDAAVRFAVWTVLLTAVACAIVATVVGAPYEGTPLERLTNITLRFAVATAIVVLLFSVGLALMALRACRLGWRDPRPTTAVVCYGSVVFLPMVGTLGVCALCMLLAYEAGWMRGWLLVPILGWVDYELLWWLGLSVLPIVAFIWWALVRLRRALRDVRFASA